MNENKTIQKSKIMSAEISELPEKGEIVIATIIKINDHGAYVSLDEYNKIQGFLHISEIAPGWIRSVNKYVKIGEKKVLLVKNVNAKSKDVDLSLKQVSNDQKKKKLMHTKKYEKGKKIIQTIQEKINMTDSDIEKLEERLCSKYDSVYDAFTDIASKGIEVISDLELSENIKETINETCSKIKLPMVEIRGVLEISNKKSNGVEIIKKILTNIVKNNKESVKITYIGAPKYRLSIIKPDFKSAEKKLKPILTEIKKQIEKKGRFNFMREYSKKNKRVIIEVSA
ncbi:MAG: S1 RNA-binding domain-containing protein [Thaumarchaeota archaeon]|nr:S1 RNA-binding domain-containing protein [Nitrososphaerota archaeon]